MARTLALPQFCDGQVRAVPRPFVGVHKMTSSLIGGYQKTKATDVFYVMAAVCNGGMAMTMVGADGNNEQVRDFKFRHVKGTEYNITFTQIGRRCDGMWDAKEGWGKGSWRQVTKRGRLTKRRGKWTSRRMARGSACHAAAGSGGGSSSAVGGWISLAEFLAQEEVRTAAKHLLELSPPQTQHMWPNT